MHLEKTKAKYTDGSEVKLLHDAFNSVCDYRMTLAKQSLSVWKEQCKIGESKQMVNRKIESMDKQMYHPSNEKTMKNQVRTKRVLENKKMGLWEQQKNLHEERSEIDERKNAIERQMNELHKHIQDMGDYSKIHF